MMLKRFAILVAWVAGFAMRAVQADVITVAQVLPEGSVEMSMRATTEAAECYLRKVSDAGGINGHTFNVVTVDAPAGWTPPPSARRKRFASIVRPHC